MNNVYKTFCAVMISMAAPWAAMSAESVKEGDLTYEIDTTEGTATVVGWGTDFENPVFDIVIPATITFNSQEYPVEAIKRELFYAMGVQTVTLGANIKTIGDYAFAYCMNLTSVIFNEGLREIGAQTFNGCSGLTELNFPTTLSSIGDFSFMSCTGLKGQINLPASLTTIGTAPWRSCTGITSYNVDAASSSFSSADGVLYNKNKTTLVAYPAGKTGSSFTIPSTVKSIAAQSMRNNPDLTSVTLPKGLETIGDQAFASSALTAVDIPASVTSIGSAAFFWSMNLKSINVDAANTAYKSKNGYLIENAGQKIVATVPMEGAVNIPDGIAEIGDYAFYNYNIESVTFPSSVRKVGKASFAVCNALKTVNLNEGLEEIGEMTFQESRLLTGVTFPSTLKTIGMQGFCQCDGITEAILPDGIENIGGTAFFLCNGLREVYIPGSVKTIGQSAFAVCNALTKATLGEGLTQTFDSMFNMCPALYDVTLPSTLEIIGPYSLYGVAFTSIELPKKLRIIQEAGLYGTQLTSLTLPDAVEEIGPYGLAWNFAMTSLRTGSGLRKIANNGIHFCTSLNNLELNEGLEEIATWGISSCTALTTLTIPSTVTTIGELAFYNNPFETLVNKAIKPQPLDAEIVFMIDDDIYGKCTLEVDPSSVEAYRLAPVWNLFHNIRDYNSGIKAVETAGSPASVVATYTLDGRQVSEPGTGVYIRHYSDGSTRKEILK